MQIREQDQVRVVKVELCVRIYIYIFWGKLGLKVDIGDVDETQLLHLYTSIFSNFDLCLSKKVILIC